MIALTPELAEQLLSSARQARAHAYAPYSKFKVGAAVLCGNGDIVSGCNVENASYGLTLCAERGAVSAAIARGQRCFLAIAVVAPGGASMCGACRQFVREFGADVPVILADESGPGRRTTLAELLPGSFGPESLDAGPPGIAAGEASSCSDKDE